MTSGRCLPLACMAWLLLGVFARSPAVDEIPVTQNDYTRAYLAAASEASYAQASAHDPQYDDESLWPLDSKKSLYAHERWPKGRVLVWAAAGTSSKMGESLNPKNWLENGKPATEPIDEDCDLVLPPSDKRYWVVMKGSKNPVPWIRHVTIHSGAGLVWLHGAKGNTWVKKGGTLKYLGWFSGDKHVFVRNDNETSLQLVDHCYVHKQRDASVEFLGAFHVSDSFYPASGNTILGPGCQLAPGSRSTLKVQDGAILTLLSGSYFTRSSNQVFGVDLIVAGTLLAGTPGRPLVQDCRIGLSWKGRRQDLSGEANNYRRERPDDAGLVLLEQGALRVHTSDPDKARLVINSNGLPVWNRHVYEGADDRIERLAASRPGINLMLLGQFDGGGVLLDDVMKGGIIVKDAEQAAVRWKNVVFGANNRGRPRDLFQAWDGKQGFWFENNDRNPFAGAVTGGDQ